EGHQAEESHDAAAPASDTPQDAHPDNAGQAIAAEAQAQHDDDHKEHESHDHADHDRHEAGTPASDSPALAATDTGEVAGAAESAEGDAGGNVTEIDDAT